MNSKSPLETSASPLTDKYEEPMDHGKMLTAFTLFPKLPTEIRLQIWRHACPNPRIIRLAAKESSRQDPAIPLIAHVNHESRCEALQIYTRGLDTENVWWNPNLDTIMFSNRSRRNRSLSFAGHGLLFRLKTWLSFSLPNIRHLAVPLDSFLLDELISDSGAELLRSYKVLETLDLVLDPNRSSGMRGVAVFYEPINVQIGILLHEHTAVTPSDVESLITSKLKAFRERRGLGEQWKLPNIKVVVMGVKRLRRSGWCLPFGSDPPRA